MQCPAQVPLSRYIDFDIYQPLQPGKDLHESWKALQDSGLPEVVWTPRNGGHWRVLRGRLVSTVLSAYANFSNHTVRVPKDTAGVAYRLLPLSLDPPAPAPFRNSLSNGLSPKAVGGVEAAIRALTVSLIEGFRARGHCNFVHDFAEQLLVGGLDTGLNFIGIFNAALGARRSSKTRARTKPGLDQDCDQRTRAALSVGHRRARSHARYDVRGCAAQVRRDDRRAHLAAFDLRQRLAYLPRRASRTH